MSQCIASQVSLPLPSAPGPAGPRTWLRRIVTGGQSVEACPDWCAADHRSDVVGNFDDLTHTSEGVGTEVPLLNKWVDGEPVMVPVSILVAQIRVDPHSEDPRRNAPYAVLELTDSDLLDRLSPDEFGAYIAQIRAHCDQLDGVHAQLVEARAEYGA